MSDIIALYGGTFNPPHVGHIKFAEEFARKVEPKRFFVIPDFRPPHKELDTLSPSPTDRLEMCRLAFGHIAEISDFEILNEKTSYTIETIRHFKKLFPSERLMFLIGDDKNGIYTARYFRFAHLQSRTEMHYRLTSLKGMPTSFEMMAAT